MVAVLLPAAVKLVWSVPNHLKKRAADNSTGSQKSEIRID